MIVLYLGLMGVVAFFFGAMVLGKWLRRYPSKINAERSSRFMQFLFFAELGIPFLISIFYPGLDHLDAVIGIGPLPYKGFFFILGCVLTIPGLYFLGISNYLLRALGSGANAFRLTMRVVDKNIYQYTRNPMSLGYYILAACIGFITNSSILTLYVFLGIIPAHVFYLKYFEEFELELRFGDPYKHYRQNVPFLIPKLTDESWK